MQDTVPDIMTIEQAAKYLQLTTETVRRAAREGSLPSAKIGRRWRIRKIDLDDFLSKGGNRGAVKQAKLPV